jgi:hypothetical protein
MGGEQIRHPPYFIIGPGTSRIKRRRCGPARPTAGAVRLPRLGWPPPPAALATTIPRCGDDTAVCRHPRASRWSIAGSAGTDPARAWLAGQRGQGRPRRAAAVLAGARRVGGGPARERVPPAVGVLEAGRDRCLLTVGSDSLDALAFQLGMLGAGCAVLEPPELIERIRTLAGRLRRAPD